MWQSLEVKWQSSQKQMTIVINDDGRFAICNTLIIFTSKSGYFLQEKFEKIAVLSEKTANH